MSNLTQIINDSFIQFSGSVLQSRALVDVRDCLKPSARQIFYCMYTDKFVHSKPFQKTLKAIGSAFRMYIHGDSSAEGVIMRAAQPFSMRYPLVDCEGSYGTLLASGSWAAPRYTGTRLSELSNYLFENIEKNTVTEWRDNYDNTEQYPTILPTKGYYNICNGTFGLGVGASSSIPQFNIKDINKALEILLLNPNASFEEIYCAPDFATGALLLNESEIKDSLKNGQGAACKLRSVVEWDSKERCFIVTQLPFMVYTETICSQLEEILNDEGKNPGIDRFNDLTGINPLIKIYLTKHANPDRVLKYLYKNTSLQYYYGINMTMLENGRFPKVFTWREALQAHIDHEKIVYRRGFEFDLNKFKKRLHIVEGLLIAIANINEVVAIIKKSQSSAVASKALQANFLLDEEQAKAILDMKLSRLANLEVTKLENEKESLLKEIAHIESILNSEELFNNELIKGWREVAEKFGDARRTQILNIENESDEPTERKQLSLSVTNKGAIFVTETSSLYSQRRHGIGTKFKLDKEEILIENIIGENTETILFFTNKGNYYHTKIGEFIIGEKQYLSNFFNLSDNEKLTAAVSLNPKNNDKFIIFVTKNGLIKKSKLSEYNLKRNIGAAAIKLDSNDEIISTFIVNDERIGLLSNSGQFIMVATTPIKAIGRVTRGIIGMKLGTNDYIVSARAIPKETTQLFSISKDGYGKISNISEFSVTGTNTKGVKIQKSDNMCDFIPVNTQSDILINSNTTQIRIKYDDVPTLGRGTQGTKLIKLTNNLVVGISTI